MIKTFKDNPNIKKIEEEIYVYNNFLSKNYIDYASNLFEKTEEKEWWGAHSNYVPGDDIYGFDGKLFPYFDNRLFEAQHNLITLFYPKHSFHKHSEFIRLKTGESVEPDFTRPDPENIYDPESNKTYEFKIEYKLVIILGEFTGGEIYWPHKNIEYKPNSGDLIIWKNGEEYSHGVKTILSGVRYGCTDYVYRHPGYFLA